MKNMLQGIRTKTHARLRALIVLEGDPNVGKSSTLIALSKMLCDDSLVYQEEKGTVKSSDRHIFIRTRHWWIGIGTAGDTEDCVKKNLAFFKRMKCDVGVIAARPSLVDLCKTMADRRNAVRVIMNKPNVKSEYEQAAIVQLCAGIIRDALELSSVSKVIGHIIEANNALEKLK